MLLITISALEYYPFSYYLMTSLYQSQWRKWQSRRLVIQRSWVQSCGAAVLTGKASMLGETTHVTCQHQQQLLPSGKQELPAWIYVRGKIQFESMRCLKGIECGGQELSRNRVVVLARKATQPGGIGSLESILGSLNA